VHWIDQHFKRGLACSTIKVFDRTKIKDFFHQLQIIIDRVCYFNCKWVAFNLHKRVKRFLTSNCWVTMVLISHLRSGSTKAHRFCWLPSGAGPPLEMLNLNGIRTTWVVTGSEQNSTVGLNSLSTWESCMRLQE
jgi:hypothetical protein